MANSIIYSLFLSKYFAAWEEDNIGDVDYAKNVLAKYGVAGDIRYNGLYQFDSSYTLSSPTTYTAITSTNLNLASTDRVFIIGEIIGDGVIQVSAKDLDGSTSIVGSLRGVGNEKFPARVLYCGKFFTNITLIPNEADVVFRIKLVTLCDASDTRYT